MVILIIYIAAVALTYLFLDAFDGRYTLDEPAECAIAMTIAALWPFALLAILAFSLFWGLLQIIRAKHMREKLRERAGK